MAYPLDNFLSEDEAAPSSEPPRPQAPVLPEGLSLRQLETEGLSLEWHEGVAIMRGLCDAVFASGDRVGPANVELEDVILDPTGIVWTSAGGARDGAMASKGVAELFRRTVQDADVPAQLTLALSLASLCTSLEEFSKSIARFERPDRAAQIRGVYERYLRGGAAAPPADAPWAPEAAAPLFSSTELAPLAAVELASPPPRIAWHGRQQLFIAAGVVVMVGLAGAALWSMQRITTVPTKVLEISRLPPTLRPSMVERAAASVDAILSHLPAVVLPASKVATAPSRQDSTQLKSEVREAEVPREAARAADRPEPLSPPAAPADPQGSAVVQLQAMSAGPTPDRIYSVDDRGVVPPVSIYPQFPSTLPDGVSSDGVAQFEVVVTESGLVESVKARRTPVTIAEALIVTDALSAAKTWRFHPGMKDGVPVRYRMTVSVLTN